MLKIREFARLGQVSVRTLRYYDELGLLSPSQVDPFTGYREYSATQLARLNRILALKDLGLSLDEIGQLLHSNPSLSQLYILLQQKHDQLHSQIQEEQTRLQRVEARLRQIEQEACMPHYDIVLKHVDALTVASLYHQFQADNEVKPLIATIYAYLRHFPVTYPAPAMTVWEDQDRGIDDVGFAGEVVIPFVGSAVPDGTIGIRILPEVETMACTVHHGSLNQLAHAYEALHTWSRTNGYRVAGPSRTVYVHGDHSASAEDTLIEVQLPIMIDERLKLLAEFLLPIDRTRVTERACQVVMVAIEEAHQKASAVQVQHLLIGLASVEKSLAAMVLTRFGISPVRIRETWPAQAAGNEIAIAGQHWSQTVQNIITQSALVAQQLGHNHIGTEHLLLALLQQPGMEVQAGLESLGLSTYQVEQAVHEQLAQQF